MMQGSVERQAEEVARLIAARLGVKAGSPDAAVARARRKLPARIRRAADELIQAAAMDRHPRLRLMVDRNRTDRAYRTCMRYLRPLGARERRRAIVLDALSAMGRAVFGVLVLVIAWLAWRGPQ
ncbi:hypothetical protein LV82_01067 [Albidovulum inexpectatum]|uniref:Uncharacterized protein n=1 Tax=Albidovulum inexpectatum TaxID=196587 RepID=A0A2S5JK69_9RHOB|nr:hypothetical protein [Albidovulum inexpectatum]PPB81850.1 hypothetical protein LV82_01067 [Albidovulum inexpectatum]